MLLLPTPSLIPSFCPNSVLTLSGISPGILSVNPSILEQPRRPPAKGSQNTWLRPTNALYAPISKICTMPSLIFVFEGASWGSASPRAAIDPERSLSPTLQPLSTWSTSHKFSIAINYTKTSVDSYLLPKFFHQLIILWLHYPGLSATPTPDCSVRFSDYTALS